MTASYPYGQQQQPPPHYPPPPRNGLVNGALNNSSNNNNKKRRNSDEIPDYASQYIPTFPTLPAHSRRQDDYHQHHQQQQQQPIWEPYWTAAKIEAWRHMRAAEVRVRRVRVRDLLSLRLGVVVLWGLVLWWGEEKIFDGMVERCEWGGWEDWPPDARPHHLVFIADPQLVDPHTYPGRPWPLSTLTMRYTDMYMRKSFQRIRDVLMPDSVLFLGDLFDGGREWSNDPDRKVDKQELVSVEKQWRDYGQSFWMKEYRRFGRIFFDTWLHNSRPPRQGQRGRRLIASLPGNHDLGLGGGIRLPSRKRFTAFFGDTNRVDVIGNHTFVSLDTVSLSAKDQVDVGAGTQGLRDSDRKKAIWEPVEQFLHEVNARKGRAIDRELRVQNGRTEHDAMDPTIFELDDHRSHTIDQQPYADSDMPSIVLTHVPLYRSQGTPCGPLREKYPPSQKPTVDGEYIEKDDRNAIPVAAGKQYQCVLTPAISNEIIEQVKDVSHVFSGDDHDYCEVVHREFTSKGGGVREITVKSTSWAMGVRHPGFLLVSLWNPIDAKGKAVRPDVANKKGTVQTHQCLLPDQLTTFIRYGVLFVATLIVLTVRASRAVRVNHHHHNNKINNGSLPHHKSAGTAASSSSSSSSSSSYLPTTRDDHHSASSANNISLKDYNHNHPQPRPRSNTASARSISPAYGYGIPTPGGEEPPAMRSLLRDNNNDDDDIDIDMLDRAGTATTRRKSSRGLLSSWWVFAMWRELTRSVGQVGGIVLVWYLYLLWSS